MTARLGDRYTFKYGVPLSKLLQEPCGNASAARARVRFFTGCLVSYGNFKNLPAIDRFRIQGGRIRYQKRRLRRKEQKLIEIADLLRAEPMAWGDIDYIVKQTGISKRSYFRYIDEMKKRGFCPTCGRLVTGLDEGEDGE